MRLYAVTYQNGYPYFNDTGRSFICIDKTSAEEYCKELVGAFPELDLKVIPMEAEL